MKLLFWVTLLLAIVAWASFAVIYSKPAATVLEQFVSPGPLSPKHAYLADSCSSCHEAAVGVTVAKCTTCHAANEALLGRQPTAFHASVAECATCHVEHQRTSIRPLTLDHALLARIGARELERAAPRDKESSTTLHSLQTWLRLKSPTDMDLASAAQTLDCAGCHDRQEPHWKRFGSDCAQCHGTESWSVPGYQHPSPRSKECVQCHQPPPSHSMQHFSMVSQKVAGKDASVERCFECHLTTSWNDIAGIGLTKHH